MYDRRLRDEIQKFEHLSLTAFCQKFRLNEIDYQKANMAWLRRQYLDDALRASSSLPDPKMVNLEILERNLPNEFWEFHYYLGQLKRMADVDFLRKIKSLRANDDYLSSVSRKLGISPSRETLDTVCKILYSIPMPVLFNLDPNAFLTSLCEMDNVPVLCVFPHLLACINDLVDLLLHLFYTKEGASFQWRTESSLRAELDHPETIISLTSTLYRTFGHSPRSVKTKTRSFLFNNPKAWYTYETVCEGAKRFVKFHEIGHLVYGHLSIQKSLDHEYKSDLFAASALVLCTSGVEREAYLTGLSILLAILKLLEQQYEIVDSTHPSTIERVSNIGINLHLEQGFYNKFNRASMIFSKSREFLRLIIENGQIDQILQIGQGG